LIPCLDPKLTAAAEQTPNGCKFYRFPSLVG
jgi:hypothetical protein